MSFSLLLTLFLVITPIFGKSIDFQESIILYGGVILFSIFNFFRRSPSFRLQKKFLIFEIILILLYAVSTIFSRNIGFSYYGFFRYLFTLTFLNLCLTNLKIKNLTKYITYFSLIYGFIFILNKLNLITLNPRPYYDNFILQIWGHSYLADFIILAIPIGIYQLIYQSPKKIKSKLFYYFSLLFLLVVLILTNSRSAAFAVTIGTLFLYLPKIKRIFKPFILLFAIFVLGYFANQIIYQQKSPLKAPDGDRFEYWQQAIKGFWESPLIGVGPNNFFYLNKKYESQMNSDTNYAHNLFFESLALNGLPFTLIFFGLIFLGLRYQFQHNILNFSLGLTSLINTLLDPSWNSFGIFCLSLFYIFYQYPLVVTPTSKSIHSKINLYFSSITFFLICLYYLTKTAADILYISGQKLLSLRFDPFSLDNSLSLSPNFQKFTISLYANDVFLYQQLAATTPLPDSEKYYYLLFSLSPKENITQYAQLANYYLQQNQYSQLNFVLHLITQNINPQDSDTQDSISVAKVFYHTALTEWKNHQFDSALEHFQNAVTYSQGWGNFQIELANAYWSLDEKDLALKQLQNECSKYPPSLKSCQEYLAQNPENLSLPGNQQNLIDSLNLSTFPPSAATLKQIASYRELIKNTPLPQSENYFYQIFNLNPNSNLDLYTKLANYYLNENNLNELTPLLSLISQNIDVNKQTMSDVLPLAKIYYHMALLKWQSQRLNEAIPYFQNAVLFSQQWGYFHIELANAYWSLNQKNLALNQLKVECQKYPVSFKYCQEYLKKYSHNFLPPGTPSMLNLINNLLPYQTYFPGQI
jgi:O-antigen ligase